MKTTLDLERDPLKGGGSMHFRYEPESKPLDGYTIKRAIHRGGFGEVYYAHSDAGKEVALKLLQDNADVELRGIAQCLNLKHPNLVNIFDVRQTDAGEQFVVMEYVAGRTLGEVIAEKPSGIEADRVEEILTQLTAGVDYLHEYGIVHRDLKPANIYLENGTVRIGDVGLAKFISQSRRSAQTQSVGTVYYMAPEIAHGRYGREVDVYALGVIVYEMLTGRVPFDGESTGEILMKQLSAEPDLSVIPENIRPALAGALTKDPEKRTRSAGEFARQISAATTGETWVQSVEPAAPAKKKVRVRTGSSGDKRHAYSPETHAHSTDHTHGVPYRPARAAGMRKRRWDEPETWVQDPANWWIFVPGGILLMFAIPVIFGFGFPIAFIALPLLLFASIAAGLYTLVRFVYRTFVLEEFGTAGGSSQREHGVRLNRQYVRYRSPQCDRQLGGLERAAESSGSMAVAAICSAIIASALLVLDTIVETPAAAVLFAIVTTLSTWAAILPSKMWEGRRGDGALRRVTTGLLGAIVGIAAFAVDDTLMIDLPVCGFQQVSEHLAGNEYLPVSLNHGESSRLTGYVAFFAMLMLVRRWWYHVDSWRPHRFRLSSVLVTAAAGWLLAIILQFPTEWGVLWAIAASTTAQLSAVWVRPEDRRAGHVEA